MLQDEDFRTGVSANFAKNIRYSIDLNRDMERFGGINFDKRRYSMFGNVGTSRIISFGGGFNWGDGIYFDRASCWKIFLTPSVRSALLFDSLISIRSYRSNFIDSATSIVAARIAGYTEARAPRPTMNPSDWTIRAILNIG